MGCFMKDRSLPTEMSDRKVEDKCKDNECRVYGRDGFLHTLHTVDTDTKWICKLTLSRKQLANKNAIAHNYNVIV